MNQPPPPYPQQPQSGAHQFAPYPGAPGGPGWQGGPGLPPPPPPKGGRTGLIIGLSAALAIAVIALVVVLVTSGNKSDDGGTAGTGDSGGTHGAGGGATAAPARPSGQPQQQAQPKTDYERVAFAYVSAVQNNDLATAKSLTCATFAPQVKVAPLGLRSPTGVVVDKIDTFQLGGASAISDSGDGGADVLVKAKVGIRVQDGANGVHWIFDVRPDQGEAKVCGQSVLDLRDIVPNVN